VKRLILADVHANLPAFEAVLRDAPGTDEVLFLGDIIGYGPHPAECLDLLRSLAPIAIIGNHDAEAVRRANENAWSESAHDVWLRWTLNRLNGDHLAYLRTLPSSLQLSVGTQQATVIHQTPGPRYLRPSSTAPELAEALAGVPGDLVYCGHVHRAMRHRLGDRELVCFPAVGQARNRDPRAGYAIETDGELEFRYVDYDLGRTARDTAAIPLPPDFAARWQRFLLTGYDPDWSRE
jgi:predicted phosphodiesterase